MKTFYQDLELEVKEEVYEPREDSFLLADAISELDLKGKKVLDIGTGSGILSLVCAREAEHVLGVDINSEAIEIARENAEKNEFNNVTFLKSDLFVNVEEKFDLIVFNPPYLPEDEENDLQGSETWNGGENGRKVIDKFLQKFPSHLKKGGEVLLLQSSLSSIEDTFHKLEPDFEPEIMREKKVPWEKLVVIKASER